MLVATIYASCSSEDVVVRYPASTPSIDTAKVAQSQITYGDTIRLHMAVSDKVAPLSTVDVRVVINSEVIAHELVRTKGNSTSFDRRYSVPFVPNRPDGAHVKVYLTLTNVEGFSKDTILDQTVAKRPLISELWYLVDGPSKGQKMTLVDPVNLIYKITGLTSGVTVNFKIASKVTGAYKRADWKNGIVFSKLGDGIGIVDSASAQSVSITDASLVGISEVTFDALKFVATVGGKKLEAVKTLDITADLPPLVMSSQNFRGGNVYFGENVEVTFTGITDLANTISPDYFEVTGPNTAKFLGKTGLYKAYYLISAGYLYIEPQPEALYPDVLWICGTGFGRPSSPYVSTASWNWNSPLDYMPCRKISAGIYQATMYCKNEPNVDPLAKYGKLDFKYFHKRGWWDGHESWASDYTVTAPFLGPADGNGNMKTLTNAVIEGVYRFTLNENDKTITAVKLR